MYAKLFTSIYQGTLRGNSHGLLVFTNLLAHADSAGHVDIHPRAIADEVGLTLEQVQAALIDLEAPDAESRSPEEDGRRIVRLDGHRAWGWRIVNYVKYRTIRSEDDRREQNRLAQQRWRDKQSSADRKQHKPRKPESAQAEAEAEADISVAKATSSAAPTDALPPCQTEALIDLYHEVLPELPRVRIRTADRQKALAKVWRWVLTSRKADGSPRATDAESAREWFRAYFGQVRDNDFLMGRTPKAGSHAGWQCTLDYLLTDRGMKMVIERTYSEAA